MDVNKTATSVHVEVEEKMLSRNNYCTLVTCAKLKFKELKSEPILSHCKYPTLSINF
jgi:hypothetical protein